MEYELNKGRSLYFRFAYPLILLVGIPVWLILAYWILFKRQGTTVIYSMTDIISQEGFVLGNIKFYFLKVLKLVSLMAVLLLAAKPQLVDVRSNHFLEGIDLILALDMSLSMDLYDDRSDLRNRLTVAKDEALKFILNRPNDEIGVVIFGSTFLKLAPPTFDKQFLKNVINDLKFGVIDGNSTALGKGFCAAIAALRNSTAKSKIIILLTDGAPTAENDIPVDQAIELAKEFGIKVYAIGIGSNNPFMRDNFGRWGYVQVQSFDEALMKKIATQTGGQYFAARVPSDMKQIYETINSLEKSVQNDQSINKYENLFWLFFSIFIFTLLIELVLQLFLWRVI